MMRISSYHGCLAAAITMAVNSKVLQLEWSTDDTVNYSKGRQLIGPDGPWQAVRFDVGAQYVLGWPTFSRWSAVIANNLTRPIRIDNTTTQLGRGGVLDSFGISGSIRNQTCWGDQYILKTGLYPKGKEYATGIQINAITTILDPCSINLPDGRTYDNTVGNLGLGFGTDLDDNFVPDPAAVLVQLKNSNITVSNSFGFHIGSAALNQSGSMVLGGYEMNRVLGPVGSLNFYRFYPFVILEDVTLGAELGALPYKNTSINSIYQGLNGDEDGATLGSVIGARVNEAVMAINPSLPYIYLPRGTCEAAAANLPVTWNENLGLYTWDTNDPKYEQIVRSSAFLGFSLVDRNRMHFVIKVPFRVLNLTLTPPMVENPTQYFPCKPSNSSQYAGFWQLGRAFLQAAFVGVTYEHSTAFLAQAPGPNGDGSVLKEISREASEIESSNIEWFQRSWNSSWMVLEETGPESPSRGPTTPITKALSPGAIGGITVGSVAFVIVLATVSILWWRFKRRSAAAKLLPVYTPEPTATIGKSRFELPINERLNVLGEIIPAEMPDQNWQPPELADKKLD